MRSVCYVGAFAVHYPRNQIIRAGLAAHGWTVHTAPLSSRHSTRQKLPLLWRSMRQEAARCDHFVLAEFNQLLGPFAALFARRLRTPLSIDYLTGLYDASILDRETARRRSPRAALFRAVDLVTLAVAPVVFTDTAAHRDVMRRLVGRAADRLRVVPVGAYDAWWSPQPAPDPAPEMPLRVQFFGSFIPFHGVDVILDAASRLEADPRFRFELIGRGQRYADAVAHAEALHLRNVDFIDPVPPPALPARVAQADICLGVFSARPKTDYVVPNKIYQCMALGKPVVTAEATAIRDAFAVGEQLVTVPPGSPDALAEALRELADQPDRRRALGAAAAACIAARYTPPQVVAPLIAAFERSSATG